MCFLKTGIKIADLREIVKLAIEGELTINKIRENIENNKNELEQLQKKVPIN